jgi:hypothetical protein
MKLSELAFVEGAVAVIHYVDAPSTFIAGYEMIPAMTIFGPIMLPEPILATPMYGGELMYFAGANVAVECGDDIKMFDYNWN